MNAKIVVLIILVLVFSSPIALAQDELPFAESASIKPPSLPGTGEESDLNMVSEEDLVVVELSLKEIDKKEQVSDVHVIVELENDENLRTIKYVDESGILHLNLEKGTYTLVLKVDKLATEGSDYFYQERIAVKENIKQDVLLLPTGSVRGTVTADGMSIPSASVKFDCPGSYGDESEVKTDKFGSFSKDYLAIGNCKVLATDNEKVGEASVEVSAGSISEVEIVLERNVRRGISLTLIILICVVIVVGVLLFHVLVMQPRRTNYKEEKKPVEKEEYNKRLNDVLHTLNKREQEIVGILSKDGLVNQSKIIHQTGIPKTSIVRIFEHLEAKKIIEVKKVGKAKHIKLTDWILEKDTKKA